MSFTLILDTSTERAFIAIAEKEKVIFSDLLPVGIQSSRWIVSAIYKGFQSVGISAHNLESIAVGNGPGLFTGIRVGVAAAKGIAVSQNIPLKSFHSLHAFIHPEEEEFFSVVDMRMGGVAFLRQRKEDIFTLAIGEPQVSSIEDFLNIQNHLPVVGPALHRLNIPYAQEIEPNVSHIARLVVDLPLVKKDLTISYSPYAVAGR